MKSIMHNKKAHTCYLCERLRSDDSYQYGLQEHHCLYGRGIRPNAEKYGLKVYLCLYHHTAGPEAVHNNKENAQILKEAAQEAFESKNPNLDFKKIFGKNVILQEEESSWQQDHDGFELLEDHINQAGHRRDMDTMKIANK